MIHGHDIAQIYHFSTDPAVLVRSVGATKDSTNVRKLLLGLCRQLCVVYDNDTSEVPTVCDKKRYDTY